MLLATVHEGINYMNMSPICDEQSHHNLTSGRCPVCHRLVAATNFPDEEKLKPQMKSLRDSEDLKKILP